MKLPEKIDLIGIPFPSAAELAGDLSNHANSGEMGAGPVVNSRSSVDAAAKALVSVANQVWRIASAVTDPDSKETKETLTVQELKKIARSIEGITEIFEDLGLRIVDRLGEPFNAGLPDQVVTEEPREGLSREMIVRTIRPTIIWNQTLVQRGEVDIAVPAANK